MQYTEAQNIIADLAKHPIPDARAITMEYISQAL
jgi:hypothetical protein